MPKYFLFLTSKAHIQNQQPVILVAVICFFFSVLSFFSLYSFGPAFLFFHIICLAFLFFYIICPAFLFWQVDHSAFFSKLLSCLFIFFLSLSKTSACDGDRVSYFFLCHLVSDGELFH